MSDFNGGTVKKNLSRRSASPLMDENMSNYWAGSREPDI
eukprot:CAMPEP_0185599224 /NCGR_PEP_ID=MMETSP0434-20130131/82542_1 /TAXON_ID=626734 ORGANISM="Favella taraikaensis, Strain Fe Narragansett Bay" /NCGR_SAMPLE_ID=MMETSP0434 /ASSEMBLY_ACC=CAM_ASM_000379 /LENGTH=38 /DNA_ID= /DNA_START= /DNA_END= /DNA_ORIENTATION=